MIRARYRSIIKFFARILISIFYWDLLLPRLGLKKRSKHTRPDRYRRYSADFKVLAIRMGGVLIKVGQFLSSRVDILPPEVTRELEGLQDEVSPVPFDEIRRVAEAEYGVPLGQKFAYFEEIPLAAASLGQVHRARLATSDQSSPMPDGKFINTERNSIIDVVVKVQRPNIENIIATDLAALKTVGKWLNYYRPIRKRVDVPALLDEFTRILYEEIDYLAEGRNAETFSANFKDIPGVRVPRVIWAYTTRRALTLENVLSLKITDYQSISDAGISRAEVASRLLDTYLKQIFEDGFFHADPHPGNLFVHPLQTTQAEARRSNPNWELTFIDFGMVGHVPTHLRAGLRELLIGVGTRDSERVVKAYQMLDVLLPEADLALLERIESKAFEQFWGKNMAELSSISFEEMQEFADEFRELLYDMPFQIPQNLIFLGRCVGILSGMCTGLDPHFNLWDHLVPYAKKIIAEEAKGGYETLLAELEKLTRSLFVLPQKMENVLIKVERGEVSVRSPEVSQQVQRLEWTVRRMISGVIFVALLLGGIQLYLGQERLFAGILLFGAGITLIRLFLNGHRRNGR